MNPQKKSAPSCLRASSSGFYPFFVIHIPLVSPTPHTRRDSFSSHLSCCVTRRTHRLSSFPSSSFILVVLALRHDIRFSRTRPHHGVYLPQSHLSSSYTYSSRSRSFGVYPFFVIHNRRARLHPSCSSSPRRPHHLFLSRSSSPWNVLATESFILILALFALSSVLASALASSPPRHNIRFRHSHSRYLFSSYSSSLCPLFQTQKLLGVPRIFHPPSPTSKTFQAGQS